jgi:hypothetical protein
VDKTQIAVMLTQVLHIVCHNAVKGDNGSLWLPYHKLEDKEQVQNVTGLTVCKVAAATAVAGGRNLLNAYIVARRKRQCRMVFCSHTKACRPNNVRVRTGIPCAQSVVKMQCCITLTVFVSETAIMIKSPSS